MRSILMKNLTLNDTGTLEKFYEVYQRKYINVDKVWRYGRGILATG